MWGWSGTDKAMTLAKLKELVKGELHYIQLGGGMGGGMGQGGSDSVSSQVTAWVQKHATVVKESAYSKSTSTTPTSRNLDRGLGRVRLPGAERPDVVRALPPGPVRPELTAPQAAGRPPPM